MSSSQQLIQEQFYRQSGIASNLPCISQRFEKLKLKL